MASSTATSSTPAHTPATTGPTPDPASQHRNVADIVFANAQADPQRIAVRGPLPAEPGDPRLEITRAQLAGLVTARAQELTAAYSVGERIVLICPTTAEFVVEFFAAQAAGLIVVPVNPLSTARELRHFLSDSGASAVIAHPVCNSAAQKAVAELSEGAGTGAAPAGGATDAEAAAGSAPALAYADIALIDAARLGAATEAGWESYQPVPRTGEDVAVLLYTSGTTGNPKGAILTVDNLVATGRMCCEACGGTPDDVFATALPLFHVFGLVSVLLSAMNCGAPITLLPRFNPIEYLQVIQTDRVTVTGGVPTMWNAVVHAPGDYDVSSLRIAISGGASIAAEVMRQFEQRFGATITEGYGLTETTANASVNPRDGRIVVGSVGLPTNGQPELCVKDDEGNRVAPGEVGEVCVKGVNVMAGYWNNPEATAKVFDDEGFFHTGDLGRMDEDGYLYIVDRLKDLIIHGGYNVYPREVEEVLYEHPGILEVAVIGIPDEKYGQTVTAVITPMPGVTLTEDEIEAYTRENLAAYKIPRRIVFVESLPKGATGKILKRSIEVD
ncbi:long-chain fatty acid--CoA ligase [Brevibacterium sp. 50QC2O2]|uniref:long-chain-fatty-acid--CoA ligase n=1 Tax=Brevibacterium TaxID=1696 RepID=UPI00211C8296|nr:long-chain fatty acid--CoA ligase [Brevibacterium sp. 91QC2O2]MCQ9386505.1 long-chain fatty acid--CoA ligase [Brevibacterium sp. 68QC2CO]MCQ9389289.1 long-chain fatty acid--CoA ligase [Brevibacterium sp. 50QC2O2]